MCTGHYTQFKKHRDYAKLTVLRPRGIGYIDKRGYRQVYRLGHPNANERGILPEHIFIMSEHLGRPLDTSHENVHHKNGDRADNRLENLELWSTKQPKGQRVKDKVRYAREILDLYGESG